MLENGVVLFSETVFRKKLRKRKLQASNKSLDCFVTQLNKVLKKAIEKKSKKWLTITAFFKLMDNTEEKWILITVLERN